MAEPDKKSQEESQKRNAEIAKHIAGTVNTPGWEHIERYILSNAEKHTKILPFKPDDTDTKIARDVRLAQSRRDCYNGILGWIKQTLQKGGINYGERS